MSSLIETKSLVNHSLSNASQALKGSEIISIVKDALEQQQTGNQNGAANSKESGNGKADVSDMRSLSSEYLRLRKRQEFMKLIKSLKRTEDMKKYENVTSLDIARHEQELRSIRPVTDENMRELSNLQDSIQINCEKVFEMKERIRMKKMSLAKSLADIQQTLSDDDDDFSSLGIENVPILNMLSNSESLENLPAIKEKEREINHAKAALVTLESRAKSMEASIKATELGTIKVENDLSMLQDNLNQVQQKEGSTRDHLLMMKEKADELRKTIQILGGISQ